MRKEVEEIFELSGDDFRNVVLNNVRALEYEAKHLTDDAKQRLIEVVEGAWPANGVRANVERTETQIRFADRETLAWLTLAPALDVAPTAEQWAELATCGAVMTDTADWLRRHYTEEAAVFAARSCDAIVPRPWTELLSAIPRETRAPDEVIEEAVAHLAELTVQADDFELWWIGERCVLDERLDALQALSAKNKELGHRLRPWRAQLGETEAARSLLREVMAALGEGKSGDRDEAEWLNGVSDPQLLPELFDALRLAVPIEGSSPFGVRAAIGRAIHRIGGEDAVQRYDELIGSSKESRFKFLRLQRDEIVQAELRRAGQAKAREVAERLSVPVLDPAGETPNR